MVQKKFCLSIILHSIDGFLIEKSKLYYPYTFSRNILLMRGDLIKFYISSSLIFLSLPYAVHRFTNKFKISNAYVQARYKSIDEKLFRFGCYLTGISMAITGICTSFLPIYLAVSPGLFFYSVAASYTAYILFHIFSQPTILQYSTGPIQYNKNLSSKILSMITRHE